MKKSTKIILIISIISLLSIIMIIPSFAVDYPESIVLHQGDIIIFNDEINILSSEQYNVFGSNTNTYKSNNVNYMDIRIFSGQIIYTGDNVSAYNNGSWTNNNYKTIEILNDITVSNSSGIKYLIDNAVSAPWIIPDPMDNVYDNSDNFLTASLSYLHTITSYITSNIVLTIILIGLALVSIAVSLIARLNRKKFK